MPILFDSCASTQAEDQESSEAGPVHRCFHIGAGWGGNVTCERVLIDKHSSFALAGITWV